MQLRQLVNLSTAHGMYYKIKKKLSQNPDAVVLHRFLATNYPEANSHFGTKIKYKS